MGWKNFLQWNTRTKNYLCTNFRDIWSTSESWKLDIRYAISARQTQIRNQFFFHTKTNDIIVVCVPSFHLPARSSPFFLAFFRHFHGKLFYEWPYICLVLHHCQLLTWPRLSSELSDCLSRKCVFTVWLCDVCSLKVFYHPSKMVSLLAISR